MFRYRLEPLLRYRKNLEDDQQRALAIANRLMFAETNQIKALESRQLEVMEWKADISKTHPDIRKLAIYDDYLAGVRMDISLHNELRKMAKVKVDQEREKLLELVKKRKTIELHREQLKERYEEEENRKERIQSDEMTLMRFSLSEKSHAKA